MFSGSVPRPVARLADEHYRAFTSKNVYVACSGMFTVERHLASIGGWNQIHSNDVLLVSEAMGRYYEGNPMPLRLSELGKERMGWLEDYLNTPESSLAALACAAQFAVAIRAKDDASPFYQRMLAETKAQWPKMHADTMAKMAQVDKIPVSSYYAGDVFDYLNQATGDDAVISYPPFGGKRDAASRYATDYSKLHPLFEWEEPKYTLLHDDELEQLYHRIADRRDWLFAVNRPIDSLEDFHRATVQTSNRGTTFYVYASNGPTRHVAPRQSVSTLKVPHIGSTDDVGDKMTLEPLDTGQFTVLRSAYMNHGIRPGNPDLMIGVRVDGLLIGSFAYSFAPTFAVWDKYVPGPSAYLMSDFPVKHSKYDRLAKLVVLASITKEAQQLCIRRGQKPYRSMTTTAFSNNPVSMKYRGVLSLLRRKQNDTLKKASFADQVKDDSYYQRPYDLQYGALLGEMTLDEALATWKKKHSHVIKKQKVED